MLIEEEFVLANLMNKHFTKNITKQLNFKKSPQINNIEVIING